MGNNKIFTLIFALIVSVGMVSCDKNEVMEAEKSMTKEMVNSVILEGKWTNMATAEEATNGITVPTVAFDKTSNAVVVWADSKNEFKSKDEKYRFTYVDGKLQLVDKPTGTSAYYTLTFSPDKKSFTLSEVNVANEDKADKIAQKHLRLVL